MGQSRFYDPETGRFLNADAVEYLDPESINGLNLYAYCGNNPVMYSDPSGHFFLSALCIMLIGGIIGSAISAGVSIVTQAISGEINWESVAVAAVSGFVSGAVAASPLGVIGQTIANAVVSGVSYVADAHVTGSDCKVDELIASVVLGAVWGLKGGNGANYKFGLSKTIARAKDVITREGNRANRKFASKAIAKAAYNKKYMLSNATWGSSAAFALTTSLSTISNAFYRITRDLF